MAKQNPNPIRTQLKTLSAVMDRLNQTGSTWNDVVIQNVDLRSIDNQLTQAGLAGCYFFGCELGPAIALAAAESQAESDSKRRCLVFPTMPWLPFNPYRAHLYHADELLGAFESEDLAAMKQVYEESVDWKSYITFADPDTTIVYTDDSMDTVLARRLHDTAVTDALHDFLRPTREGAPGAKKGIVAIMGGHDMLRTEKRKGAPAGIALGDEEWEAMSDDATYTRVAFLAWKLTQDGYLLVSGGGPGAMEATNLGAYFASRTLVELRAAIHMLEAFKEFKTGKSTEWLIPAMSVRRRYPVNSSECQSVGIPTWFYGHEPPNPFASHIAKYFENSVREEGMLAIATHGVVFAEGNAGTVQEIFQDACQNYYGTYGTASPMILYGQDYWDPPTMPIYVNDKRKKVFLLVRKLAEEKGFSHRLLVSDSLREIIKVITAFKP